MPIYLAIDQGGSKTEALIFDERGAILGRGDDRPMRAPESYASYQRRQGEYMRAARAAAEKNGGVSAVGARGAVCALNGADWAEDYPRLKKLSAEALFLSEESVKIVNDCVGAMRGGAGGRRKAVICIGTGLNVCVSDGARELIYGYFIADCDQGGNALGREAWRAVIDAETGLGEQTALTTLILRYYGTRDIEELYIAFTNGGLVRADRDLAPLVTAAAAQGDAVARGLIDQMAGRLAQYVARGMEKLGISGQEIRVVLSGGVTKGCGYVLTRAIENKLRALEPLAVCAAARYEPVAGAALIQLDEIYPDGLPDSVKQRFDADAKRLNLILSGAEPGASI